MIRILVLSGWCVEPIFFHKRHRKIQFIIYDMSSLHAHFKDLISFEAEKKWQYDIRCM